MLTRLYVDNYKCLVNFELPLGEVSLLLGPNGAGKSAAFDVVYALRQLLTGIAKVTDREVFPASTLTRWQSSTRQTFQCNAVIEEDEYTYQLEVEHESDTRKARIASEKLDSRGRPLFACVLGEVTLYHDDHMPGPSYTTDWSESALARVAPRKDNRKLTRFLGLIRRILVCGLYPRSFGADATTEEPLLARDGSNFAAWYRHVVQERQDLMPRYHADVREVLEGFDGIRLEKVGPETRTFLVAFTRDAERYEVRLDELSDGQRALLALYALIRLSQGQGYTLFLDEPDNYVALPEIQPWLMALKDACGNGVPQAVLTSHHPELIDYLGAEAGLWLERKAGGPTTVRRLVPPEDGGLKLSEVIARGWPT